MSKRFPVKPFNPDNFCKQQRYWGRDRTEEAMTKATKRCRHKWLWVGSSAGYGKAYWCETCGTMRFTLSQGRPVYQRPTGEA